MTTEPSATNFQTYLICWHPNDAGRWVCDCGEGFGSNATAIIHKSEHRRHKIYWQCAVCGELLTPSTPALRVVAATTIKAAVASAAASS